MNTYYTDKKYEFTGETKFIRIPKDNLSASADDWVKVHRIRAVNDFSDVREGDFGGWVEKKSNLHQDDNAWVYDEAIVCGNSEIERNASIHETALVYGDAIVSDHAEISGSAEIYEHASVSGDSIIRGEAKIHGNAIISGSAFVKGNVDVYGSVYIADHAKIHGIDKTAKIYGDANILGRTQIYDDADIFNSNQYMTIGPIIDKYGYMTFYRGSNGKILIARDMIVSSSSRLYNTDIDDFIKVLKSVESSEEMISICQSVRKYMEKQFNKTDESQPREAIEEILRIKPTSF